jgi:ketosteroid isomerase-like protein
MHPISFPKKVISLAALAFAACAPLLAHEDKPHAAPAAVQDPVATAVAAVSQIESLVAAQKLDGIHEQTDLLGAALKEIGSGADRLGADQKRRLEAAVKQVSQLADSVHEAADAAQQKKAETEARKLSAAFKLLQAQLGSASGGSSPPPVDRPQPSNDEEAVRAVLAAYKRGLERLDVSQLSQLFSEDSQIFESGGVEGTFANYLAHHIGPELGEFAEFSFRDYKADVRVDSPYAFGTETYLYKIVLKTDGRVIERKGVATSVLKKTGGQWQIVQMHSSSRNPPKAK